MSIQIQQKSLRHQNLQLIEAMSSQLSIFHLHMTSFSSWNNGGSVCKLADLREAASKIHSILVRSCSSEREELLASGCRLAISTLLIAIVRLN
jgi:hypothetical protein